MKLYMIVNIEEAKKFRIIDCVIQSIDFIQTVLSNYPDRYEINYGMEKWKSKKKFEDQLHKIQQTDIFHLSAFFKNSKSLIRITNNMLNIQEISLPNKSFVNLTIAVPRSEIYSKNMDYFLLNMYDLFHYKYGYIFELTDEYDFVTERKMKRNLFGQETVIKEIDLTWQFHSIGINYGYLKNIYPVNIFNDSHISQPLVKQLLLEKIGNIKRLNGYLNFWTLNEKELIQVKKRLITSKYIIANDMSSKYFLESNDAKKFYDDMKVNSE